MKTLLAIVAFLLLLTGSVQADTFNMKDLKKTWVFNGAGCGKDAFGQMQCCTFGFTVRIGDGGVVNGKAGFIDFAGQSPMPVVIVGGQAELGNMAAKYALWRWQIDVQLPDGTIVTFNSKTRFQFSYTTWDENGKALGPFDHATGRWCADNGMCGLVAVQKSKNFQKDP